MQILRDKNEIIKEGGFVFDYLSSRVSLQSPRSSESSHVSMKSDNPQGLIERVKDRHSSLKKM